MAMKNSAKYESIRSRLEAAGLTSPTTGVPMRIGGPSPEPEILDMEIFGAKIRMADLAMQLIGMADNFLYARPDDAQEILQQAAEKMCNLAIRYRG
jgi:hypothetical protein